MLIEGITGRNYSRSVRFNGTGRDLRQRETCAPLACICNAYVALAKIFFASGVRKLFFSRKDAKAPLARICNACVALAKVFIRIFLLRNTRFTKPHEQLFASQHTDCKSARASRKDAKAQRRTCSKRVSYCFSGMY